MGLREFLERFRSLFAKKRLERELDQELNDHLEMLVEENLQRGMSPTDARAAARRSFGGVAQIKEAYRDQRGFPVVDSLNRDLRFGTRILLRHPVFTIVSVITLALGIGANTAIFTVVNAVLLNSFPYRDAQRLVLLGEKRREMRLLSLSYPDFSDLHSQNTVFESLGAVRRWNPNLTGDGEPERLQAAMVTAEIFSTLGISPLLGRWIADDEDRPGAERVVVVSHEFWARRFGSDSTAVGRSLTLDQQAYTIIGVMPPRFDFWSADVWAPIGLISSELNRRDLHPGIFAIGRIKSGLKISDVRTDLEAITGRLEEAYPQTNSQIGADAVLWQEQVGSDLRPALLMLFAAVALVLLIAGANLVGLQLGRVTGRRREFAIRAALGATRWSLVRQLLIENVLLALAGGALGLLVVFWSLGPLVRLIPEGSFTAETRFSIDGRVLAFTALISIGAGILFGLAPAIKVSSSGISDLIKSASAGSTPGRRAIRARDLLIALEVAIAVVLVCGAALLVKSFLRLHDIHPGFDTHQVLAVGINLPERNRDARKSADYVQAILDQIQSLPGVTSASASQALPFVSASRSTPTTLLDRDEPEKIEYLPVFQLMIVSSDYFRTLRIPINAGRTMSDQDRADGPLIAVINQTAARMFWANDDPIGRTVRLGPPEHMVAGAIPPDFHFPRAQIVGVVGDVRFDSLEQRAEPQIYTSLRQTVASNAPTVWGAMRIAVRCEQDPLSLVQAIRGAVWSVNKDQPVSSIATLDDLCSQSMDQPRMSSTLMGLLAGVALILALIGIYGVISYSIGERRREIGIRIALGADRRTILKLVVGRTITFVVCGLVVGTATVIALGRLLETMMYGMSSRDPLVLVVVSVFLAATAIFASWRPAIRATRIDPIAALRSE